MGPQVGEGAAAVLLDLALLLLGLVLVFGIADLGSQMAVSFHPSESHTRVDLHPALLPYYAARSCLRMFVGLAISLVLAITLGSLTSRSPLAERLLLPMVDVLQSVPVLGFLAVSVPFFLRLFPGRLLGLEAAALFAIVTSQVWNLIFCYHQSLKTIPVELREASRVMGLTGWQRLTRLELPASAIPLVWNGMMSFAGGWFFVTQSEAISVNNTDYVLPGLGSYVASAISQQRLDQVVYALLTMLAMIVLIDQLFWRPLVAWSEQFRMDPSPAATPTSSWFLAILAGSAGLRRLTGLLINASGGLRRSLNLWTAPALATGSHRLPSCRSRRRRLRKAWAKSVSIVYGWPPPCQRTPGATKQGRLHLETDAYGWRNTAWNAPLGAASGQGSPHRALCGSAAARGWWRPSGAGARWLTTGRAS